MISAVKQPASARAFDPFATWKTVTIGKYKTVDEYTKQFHPHTHGAFITGWAHHIVRNMPLSQSEIELDLVRPTVGDLGFNVEASLSDIITRAPDFGLALCPAEAVCAMALLDSVNRSSDEQWVRVVMEPIMYKEARPYVLMFHRSTLRGYYNRPQFKWHRREPILLVKPRK